MSFPATLTLKNALNADITFIRLSGDDISSIYSRADSPIGLPQTLRISKTMAPAGTTGNDKFLVKFVSAAQNAVTGKVEQAVQNFTISLPRSFTAAQQEDLASFQSSFLTSENQAKLRRGEV